MHFGFSDDQMAFRDTVRALLADACPPAAVRAAWASSSGVDPSLWEALGSMGVFGILAPEAVGGLGLSEVDLVLLLEETGRAAMPGPVVEHALVAVPLLAALGRSDLLAAALAGTAVLTFADRASRVGWADSADAVLLASDSGVRLVPRDALTHLRPLESVDRSRRSFAVDCSGGSTVLGADVELALDRAALGAAAQLCGLAAHLIEVTVEYTSQRRQFGVPIGSYQALKHHLANALLRLERARPPVYRAAWSMAHGVSSRSRDVSMAKAMANDAAAFAARVALQCHGAIGYTWESDLHLWLKRVWVLERAWGDTAHHRARVADAVLGP